VIKAPRTHIGPRVLNRSPQFTYAHIQVTPLGPLIGAEISKVDLAEQPFSPEVIQDLKNALLEWKVLFFRDQTKMESKHQISLAKLWGDLEAPHPFYPKGENQDIVRFVKGPESTGNENLWHSDVSWKIRPPSVVVLRLLEVPSAGGDTLWADMQAAFDNLDSEKQSQLKKMTAVHNWVNSFGGMNPEQQQKFETEYPPVHHPVIRTHPETGRSCIYVNVDFTDYIENMSADESLDLLKFLWAQAAIPEYQVRFHWTANTVAVWDNRCTQHYAVSDYNPQRRVGERVSVEGERPM